MQVNRYFTLEHWENKKPSCR